MLLRTASLAVDIFYLIGLTITGLSKNNLTSLFPNKVDLEGTIKTLENTSLIYYDSKAETFKVQNFIT